jgi:hypothetical protein
MRIVMFPSRSVSVFCSRTGNCFNVNAQPITGGAGNFVGAGGTLSLSEIEPDYGDDVEHILISMSVC